MKAIFVTFSCRSQMIPFYQIIKCRQEFIFGVFVKQNEIRRNVTIFKLSLADNSESRFTSIINCFIDRKRIDDSCYTICQAQGVLQAFHFTDNPLLGNDSVRTVEYGLVFVSDPLNTTFVTIKYIVNQVQLVLFQVLCFINENIFKPLAKCLYHKRIFMDIRICQEITIIIMKNPFPKDSFLHIKQISFYSIMHSLFCTIIYPFLHRFKRKFLVKTFSKF